MGKTDVSRTVSLVINNKQAKVSIDEIKTAVFALTRNFNHLKEVDNPELYRQKKAELLRLKQTWLEMRGAVNQTTTASKRFLDNIKTIAAGVVGGNLITGFFTKIQSVIDNSISSITKKSDELSNVQKTTGLAGAELKDLEKQLGKIDTRTGRSELRKLAVEAGKLGYEGVENVKKFVEEANVIKVALSEDLGEDAILKISKASKQFNEGMLNISSGVNAVGAASEASEQYLVDFMSRLAPIAEVADVSAGAVLGYGASLEIAGLQVEMSSTALNTFFVDFVKNTEKFGQIAGFAEGKLSKIAKDKGYNEAFLQMLTQLKAANPEAKDFLQSLEDMGIDGTRGSTVFLALANNIDQVRANQALATEEVAKGTSVLDEYNIKNNNEAAQYEKALKRLNAGLKPFMESLGRMAIQFITFIADNVKGLMSIAKMLTVGAAAWAAYRLAVLLSDRANIAFFTNLLKTERILKLQKIATMAAAAAQALLSGNIKRAGAAMRVFNMLTKLNPWGLLIAGIVAAATAFALFNKRIDETEVRQRRMNDLRTESEQSIVSEKLKLEQLLAIAKDENRSKADRERAIAAINKISPKYLGNITLETVETDKATVAISNYIAMLQKRALYTAAQSKLEEASKKKLEIANKPLEDELNLLEQIAYGYRSGIVAASKRADSMKSVNSEIEQYSKLVEDLGKELGVDAVINTTLIEPPTKGDYETPEDRDKRLKKEAKELADKKDKELKEIEKGFADIQKAVEKHHQEMDLIGLDADQKELEQLNQKYEEQFNKLLEYQARVQNSDLLTNDQKLALEAAYQLAESQLIDAHQAELDAKKQAKNKETEEQRKLDAIELQKGLLSEHELEIQQVNTFYDRLVVLAEGNAEILLQIQEKRNAALLLSDKNWAEKQLDNSKALAQGKYQIATEASAILLQLANNAAGQNAEFAEFAKAVAIFNVGVNTASAISEALAKSYASSLDPIAGTLKFLAVSASILSAAGNIKSIISGEDLPSAPQFYGGGLTDVYGANDGKRYSAQRIGSISNGGRIGGASLGLFGEKGPEFVIPNSVYANPANANLMTALSSTVQSANQGGSAAVGGGASASSPDVALNNMLMKKLLEVLSKPLESPVYFDLQSFEEATRLRDSSKSAAKFS